MKNPNFNPFDGIDGDPLLDLLAEGYEKNAAVDFRAEHKENAAVAFRDEHKVVQFPNIQGNSVSCPKTQPVSQKEPTDTELDTGYGISD